MAADLNVLLFGATGMVGRGALLACLDHPRVARVTAIVRTTTGISHPKLREIMHADFFNYDGLQSIFASVNACFFCLGVSSVGMKEADYTRLTYDLTMAAAKALAAVNCDMTFCYVSGVGTDSSERGRVMWARVKGRTENALRAMPFRAAYMFRPGLIQPVKGVRSKTRWVQALYLVTAFLYPLLRVLLGRQLVTTETLGRALIGVAINGYPERILHPPDINRAAGGAPS